MITRKELIKKRWLLGLSFFLIYIVPLAIILEKTVIIKRSETNVSIHFMAFIFGLLYIAFISKKAKTKLEKMKFGFFKSFLSGLNSLTAIITVSLLVHIVIVALNGFHVTMWVITGSMFLGVLIQAIEAAINKELIYDIELYEIAKKEVDLEDKKDMIRRERKVL